MTVEHGISASAADETACTCEPRDRKAGHGLDEFGTALGAAAVPVQLRFPDPQTVECLDARSCFTCAGSDR
ncbi:Uncharacterised protein [Mycobacteroides abscessus subsp. abscessus]|nr:Uncharacterised protein [Mycobacteroides abscessus subsp. abscessus]